MAGSLQRDNRTEDSKQRSLRRRRIRRFFFIKEVEEDPCKRVHCYSSLNADDGGLSIVPVFGFIGSTSFRRVARPVTCTNRTRKLKKTHQNSFYTLGEKNFGGFSYSLPSELSCF